MLALSRYLKKKAEVEKYSKKKSISLVKEHSFACKIHNDLSLMIVYVWMLTFFVVKTLSVNNFAETDIEYNYHINRPPFFLFFFLKRPFSYIIDIFIFGHN